MCQKLYCLLLIILLAKIKCIFYYFGKKRKSFFCAKLLLCHFVFSTSLAKMKTKSILYFLLLWQKMETYFSAKLLLCHLQRQMEPVPTSQNCSTNWFSFFFKIFILFFRHMLFVLIFFRYIGLELVAALKNIPQTGLFFSCLNKFSRY